MHMKHIRKKSILVGEQGRENAIRIISDRIYENKIVLPTDEFWQEEIQRRRKFSQRNILVSVKVKGERYGEGLEMAFLGRSKAIGIKISQ